MLKKILFALVLLIVIVGAIVMTKLDQFTAMGEAAKKQQPPPVTVTASTIEQTDWEQTLPATATVTSVQGVRLSVETTGRITRINFESGDRVKAGTVLIELDRSSELAQLASAQAAADLARSSLARAQKLSRQKLASQDVLDNAVAQVKETEAQILNVQAALAKKTIRAPFSGRLGFRQVNLGEVVHSGEEIVALQILDPVYVDFSLPQQNLKRISAGLPVRATVDAFTDQIFTGQVMTIDSDIDPKTRSLRVRARVDNPAEQLRPGMFARVNVVLPHQRQVLPVPQTAIAYASFGDSVFVIDEQKDETSGETQQVLRQQFVQLGQKRGDFVEITDGLEAGEQVVTSGVFKLRSGSKVVIDNTLAPKAELQPQPSDS